MTIEAQPNPARRDVERLLPHVEADITAKMGGERSVTFTAGVAAIRRRWLGKGTELVGAAEDLCRDTGHSSAAVYLARHIATGLLESDWASQK